MIFESIIREACSQDPVQEAKDRVQTRRLAALIKQRRAIVHSALARSIPIEGQSAGCSGSPS